MLFEIQVVHAGKQVAASPTSAAATSCFSPAIVAAAKLVAATQIELLLQKWYLLQNKCLLLLNTPANNSLLPQIQQMLEKNI